MQYVAVNHVREEYVISEDFRTLWRFVMRDRRWDRHLDQLKQPWEIGYGCQLENELPRIVGAPIVTFVGGRPNVAIVYQQGITKIHRM